MNEKIQQIQTILGVTPDGAWGPKSQAALESVLHPASPAADTAAATGDRLHWPKEADAPIFYGRSDGSSAWEEEHLVLLPAPYALFMDGQLVRNIRCHKLVRDSLRRILTAIRDLYKTPEAIHAAGLDQYDGCYNYRVVRGASHLSMHAYGAAVDFDAADNPLGATHGRMPAEVVAIFKAEGWRWGGDYTGRQDWMHFEACT
jgi:hypothetical protein